MRAEIQRQSFLLLRLGRGIRAQARYYGSYQITGPCPQCGAECTFVIHGTLHDVGRKCHSGGYACDACSAQEAPHAQA